MSDSNHFLRIEKKIDQISEKISDINVILAKQHVSLEDHMKRSDMLEKHLEVIQIKTYRFEGAVKILGSAGIIVAALRLLKGVLL